MTFRRRLSDRHTQALHLTLGTLHTGIGVEREMEAVVEDLSAMVGLRPSMILFIAALIMSVPAALVARYVKPGITRY